MPAASTVVPTPIAAAVRLDGPVGVSPRHVDIPPRAIRRRAHITGPPRVPITHRRMAVVIVPVVGVIVPGEPCATLRGPGPGLGAAGGSESALGPVAALPLRADGDVQIAEFDAQLTRALGGSTGPSPGRPSLGAAPRRGRTALGLPRLAFGFGGPTLGLGGAPLGGFGPAAGRGVVPLGAAPFAFVSVEFGDGGLRAVSEFVVVAPGGAGLGCERHCQGEGEERGQRLEAVHGVLLSSGLGSVSRFGRADGCSLHPFRKNWFLGEGCDRAAPRRRSIFARTSRVRCAR